MSDLKPSEDQPEFDVETVDPKEAASEFRQMMFRNYTTQITALAERLYLENASVLEQSDEDQKRLAMNSYRAALNFQHACFDCKEQIQQGIHELIIRTVKEFAAKTEESKKD